MGYRYRYAVYPTDTLGKWAHGTLFPAYHLHLQCDNPELNYQNALSLEGGEEIKLERRKYRDDPPCGIHLICDNSPIPFEVIEQKCKEHFDGKLYKFGIRDCWSLIEYAMKLLGVDTSSVRGPLTHPDYCNARQVARAIDSSPVVHIAQGLIRSLTRPLPFMPF